MSTGRVVFKSMVFACAGMVVVYYAVGALLAAGWEVTSTRSIVVPPERIAATVSDLATWRDWAAVEVTLGPHTECQVVGTAGTVGHALHWSGSQGTASLTLRRVTPEAIEYEFAGATPGGEPRPRSSGGIAWRNGGAACEVRWHDEGTFPDTHGRWWGWFGAMHVYMRQIQTASLEGLARRVEPGALQAVPSPPQPADAK